MALINCPNCGRQISDKAEKCVHCGYSLHQQNIKKDDYQTVSQQIGVKKSSSIGIPILIITLLCIVAVFAVIWYEGMSDNYQPNRESKSEITRKSEETNKPAKPNQKTIPEILSETEIYDKIDQTYGAETVEITLRMSTDGTFTYYMMITNNINSNQSSALGASGKYHVSGSFPSPVQIGFEGRTGSGSYFTASGELTKESEHKYFFKDGRAYNQDKISVNYPKLPDGFIYE